MGVGEFDPASSFVVALKWSEYRGEQEGEGRRWGWAGDFIRHHHSYYRYGGLDI